MFWHVVEVAAIARDEAAGAVRNAECGRALCISLNGSARYAWAWDNKSFDASGITLLAIDNLSVTWLTAAASTPRWVASGFPACRNAVSLFQPNTSQTC